MKPTNQSTSDLDTLSLPSSSEDLTPPETDDIRQARNGKLTYQDIGLLVSMRNHDPERWTQKALAEYFHITQPQISKLLAAFSDTTNLARLRLKAESDRVARATLKAIDVAAARGDAEAGLELLDRLEVAKKRQTSGDGGAKVMIVVGGGAALPELPVIDQ